MGFQTPLYELSDYLKWTTGGKIQLPDFQRGFKWDEERIRQLLVTILRSHPLGVVMLLKSSNQQVRFKPRPITGTNVPTGSTPEFLLLDGQQRLTSLTQALTGNGVVDTMDSRGKNLQRRYYIDMRLALEGEDRIDEAVIGVPADGVIRSDFGRHVDLDLSTEIKEREQGYFPVRLLFAGAATTMWLFAVEDKDLAAQFFAAVIQPATTYNIPAIELDGSTSKSAVATVFEKVNTGGLALNVFELLTATFAGDGDYYAAHGQDFRLNDDWRATQERFTRYPALEGLENTDFLQAVTMLATHKRRLADTSGRLPAVSAKREDILKLTLADYLEWVDPLREAFAWSATFLADHHIFDARFVPYQKQLVPLAAIRVLLGGDADLHGPRERIARWFWCGILGELYGGAIETRFVRDLDQVPAWAKGVAGADTPKTITDATFVESRLHSLRTRQSAAYKGIYALLLSRGARDWMRDLALDKVQYVDLKVDIHHIFPKRWCEEMSIDAERRESIVNKTAISATSNQAIGGAAPSAYLPWIERRAQVAPDRLDRILASHLVPADSLRADDFDAFFSLRREALCQLVEQAMGKPVPRDLDEGDAQEDSTQFDEAAVTEEPGEDD